MTDWNAAPPPRDRPLAAGLVALVGSLAFGALVVPAILPVYERAAYRRVHPPRTFVRDVPRFTPPPLPSPLSDPETAAPATATCDPQSITPEDEKAPGHVDPPPVGERLPATVPATIRLTQGDVRIEMYGRRAACTVASMTYLARRGFFDGSSCHRVTTDGIFILQCGDPTGSGAGGPGYTLPEENTAGATYPAGTVALARAASAHTGGSQFFVVYREAAAFPPGYTVFGRVVSGLDVIQDIAANGVEDGSTDGRPAKPVWIESFVVETP